MKKIICTILFLMMVFGTMTAPAWAESDSVDRILSSMSLRDKVAQMMIASFRVWEEVPAENGDKPEGEPVKENITALNDPIRLTIGAGVDMLILPSVKDTASFRLTDTYIDSAAALVERGEISEERINESVHRILEMKQKYGILDQTDFSLTDEQIASAGETIGSAGHMETEWQMAEKSLTLLKNEKDAFPLNVKAGEKTLILFANSCTNRAGTGDQVRKMLEERPALPKGAEIVVMRHNRDNDEECVRAAVEADHVILVHRVYNQACMDPATADGFSSGTFDRIISAVHETGKTVILVSCQLPYDAARFPEADAMLLAYWGGVMRDLPADGSTRSTNLPAELLACFGVGDTRGKLPVNIPDLDENFQPTDKILWSRGEPARQ